MQYLQSGSFTVPFTSALVTLGAVCATSSNGATEFMFRPQMWIKQQTGYIGIGAERQIPSLSSQEIVTWLRDEGIPIAVIADIAGVERKSVYAWLGGGAVRPHNQERLEKIYSLLKEDKLTNLCHLYRFWSRNVIGERSLRFLFEEKVLNEASIRHALMLLWPLAKKESLRESSSNASIKSNPFFRDSREVTISYEAKANARPT